MPRESVNINEKIYFKLNDIDKQMHVSVSAARSIDHG
jgi:hypothetical protein